jgi:glycerol-3-phosphate acyltransferase PlsY
MIVLTPALSAAASYLIGTAAPAYWLGRALKGIDIRTVGFENSGTRNVKATLGLWPAVLTAIVDTTKGIGAVLFSTHVLGLPESLIFIPAAASVAGHIYPFYLGFRGGKGSATAIGLFIFFTIEAMLAGTFSLITFGVILLSALIVYVATRSGDATGIVAFASMLVLSLVELGLSGVGVLNAAISGFLLTSITLTARRHGVFSLEGTPELKLWRVVVRPLALLFIPIDVAWGRRPTLILMAVVTVIFVLLDLYRLLSRRRIDALYKKREGKRFSSMTLFLVSVFLSFLLFKDDIPYLCLSFVTMGDLFSKLIGLKYGTKRLFKRRTLQGSLGFLAGSLLTSYIVYRLLPSSLLFVGAGAVFATLVELFSEPLDDNMTVSVVTGGFLSALRYFLPV